MVQHILVGGVHTSMGSFTSDFNSSGYIFNYTSSIGVKMIENIKQLKEKYREPANEYDFKQQIMSCWNVIEDLDQFTRAYLDGREPMSEDQVATYMIGTMTMYNTKFERLFEMFEELY
jgi:hypothetical protein